MPLALADLKWFCSAMCQDIARLVRGRRQKELFENIGHRVMENPANNWNDLFRLYHACRAHVGADSEEMHILTAGYLIMSAFDPQPTAWTKSSDLQLAGKIFQSFCTKQKRPDVFGPYQDFLTDHGLTLKTLDAQVAHLLNQTIER